MTPPPEPVLARGFVVDVGPLLRWPGNQCLVAVDVEVTDLTTTAASVQQLRVTLIAEAMSDSLSVGGELEAAWEGDCRRCLDPTTGTVAIEVKEMYEREPVDGETFQLTDDRVDLEPMLRELVLLSLPLAPLCRELCEGPSPETFPAGRPADDQDEEVVRDPRWAALDDLTFDD